LLWGARQEKNVAPAARSFCQLRKNPSPLDKPSTIIVDTTVVAKTCDALNLSAMRVSAMTNVKVAAKTSGRLIEFIFTVLYSFTPTLRCRKFTLPPASSAIANGASFSTANSASRSARSSAYTTCHCSSDHTSGFHL
jgi:hypothetical protein